MRAPRVFAAVGSQVSTPALSRRVVPLPCVSHRLARTQPHFIFNAPALSSRRFLSTESGSGDKDQQARDTKPSTGATSKIKEKLPTKLQAFAAWEFPSREFTRKYPVFSFTTKLCISSLLGLTVLVGALLLHDSFTYSERHVDRVPTNPLSLKPRRGGKKNLPIIEANLDDEEDETKRAMKDKPRLVVIGGGWGVSNDMCFG